MHPRRISLALFCVVALASCATGPGAAPAVAGPVARVVLQNLTSYRWRVTLERAAPAASPDRKIVLLAPLETAEIACTAGEYAIEQARLSNDGTAVLETRPLSARFDAGEAYEWPLVTVLSSTKVAAGNTSPP